MIGRGRTGRRRAENCVLMNCRAARRLRIATDRGYWCKLSHSRGPRRPRIGTIIVLGLVGYWLGIDPSVLIGGAEILTGGGTSQQQSYPGPRDSAQTGAPSDQMGQLVSAVLGSTEAQWQKIFAQYGKAYEPPTLVMSPAPPLGLRVRAIRDGPVLLPERLQGLSRHLVLSGSRATLPRLRCGQQVVPILAGLRDRP